MCADYNLALSIVLARELNPFRPLRLFDLGHIDTVLWTSLDRPRTFSFHTRSQWAYLLSALTPQEGRMIVRKRLVSVPSFWQRWLITRESYRDVEEYLASLYRHSKERLLKYHAGRFNCFHVAYRCLQIAGVPVPQLPLERVAIVYTVKPKTFMRVMMPSARYSIMSNDLGPKRN